MRAALAVSLTLLALAGSADAQSEPADAPFESAFARLVVAVLAPSEARDLTSWDRVATAGERNAVRWHFHAPDNFRDRELAPGRYRRGGYLQSRGATQSVALCGTRTAATALALRHSTGLRGRGRTVREAAPTIAALNAAGVRTWALPDSDPLPDGEGRRPWVARWRVQTATGGAAELRAAFECTSPHARSAQRCWTNWTLEWQADEGRHCAVPGRG